MVDKKTSPKPRALLAVVVLLILESLLWLFLAPLLADFSDNVVWVILCLAISLIHIEASYALIARKKHARIANLIITSMNWLIVLASSLVALVILISNPSDLEHYKTFGYFGTVVVIAIFVAIPTLIFATSYTILLFCEPSKKWFEDISGPGRNMNKKYFIPLVVFLTLATVAGSMIFTFALISDNGRGKEQRAKAILRNAITEVRATQTGLTGSIDSGFSSIDQKVLSENESDINWVNINLADESNEGTVALIELSETRIVMQTTDGETCYFAELNAEGPIRTRYGTAGLTDGRCPSTAGTNGGNDFTDDTSLGWKQRN